MVEAEKETNKRDRSRFSRSRDALVSRARARRPRVFRCRIKFHSNLTRRYHDRKVWTNNVDYASKIRTIDPETPYDSNNKNAGVPHASRGTRALPFRLAPITKLVIPVRSRRLARRMRKRRVR